MHIGNKHMACRIDDLFSGTGSGFIFPPFRYFLPALFLSVSCLMLPAAVAAQTELGSADDLTVLGATGTALDPDVEVKGFAVFGSTQSGYTGAVIGPGNVVVNGALSVSSGAYFVGNSTFTGASKIYINDGAAGEILRKDAAGYLNWADPASMGDNLGNHTATKNLELANFNISGVNYMTASSATFTNNVTGSSFTATGNGLTAAQIRLSAADSVAISSEASAALGGGVRVSTNVYIVGFSSATKYYGDGSALTGLSAASQPSIDVSTINAAASTPYGGVNVTTNTYVQGKLGISTLAPRYALEVSSAAGSSGTLLAVSTGTSVMVEVNGTGEIISRKLTVTGGAARITSSLGDISLEPAGNNVNVTKNITVEAGRNVGFEGSAGDTYMAYDSVNHWISVFADGAEIARFKP